MLLKFHKVALGTRAGVKSARNVRHESRCRGDVLASLPLVSAKCWNEFDHSKQGLRVATTFECPHHSTCIHGLTQYHS